MVKQESLIDTILSADLGRNPSSHTVNVSPLQRPITRTTVIQELIDEMQEAQNTEARELIHYISQEDAETCINVVFVLARPGDAGDIESIMSHLQVSKLRLLNCMN